MNELPALSVVLVTPHRYDTLRKTMRCLRAQTVASQIEVVIVAPQRASFGYDPNEQNGFYRVQVIETGQSVHLGQAKAIGVRHATAPIVAFAEDHCYPAPRWAAELLKAHQEPWTAVSPAIGNANPESLFSWANLLIAYGHWLEPATSRPVDDVPAHNSSYKRDALLAFGEELDHSFLGREGSLHQRLKKDGHRFYLEANAQAYHLNPTHPLAWLALRFNAGRLYAATRAESNGWTLPRKLMYIAGAPLIPVMRLRQLIPQLRRTGRDRELLPKLLPILVLLLVIHSLGEMAGYALDEGTTRNTLANFEFDRVRQLSRQDQLRHAEVL
jgi:hypothetical protein